MRRDLNSALAYLALAEVEQETEVDDETDLLADAEEETCPTCGGPMVEYEEDSFQLECPVCDRRFR